jgi:hypothetical protein
MYRNQRKRENLPLPASHFTVSWEEIKRKNIDGVQTEVQKRRNLHRQQRPCLAPRHGWH